MPDYFKCNLFAAIFVAILIFVTALPTSVLVETKSQQASTSEDTKGKFQTKFIDLNQKMQQNILVSHLQSLSAKLSY